LACASGPTIGVSARAAMVKSSTAKLAQCRLWSPQPRALEAVRARTACPRCGVLRG
jgi:hypothetical protein